jgi:NAD(P)-dependent dehydrogenase (short-subunit alcohol dehydrogenase family)
MTGKVAFVTGGSSGIGLAIARTLVDAGVKVAITGRNQSKLEAAVNQTPADKRQSIHALRADVRHYAEVEAAIAATVNRFSRLDIVVNNAGVGGFADVASMTPDQWSAIIDTNLTGVFNTCHAAIPHLRRAGGFIINISSLAGKNAFAGGAAYCASKSGLNAFSEALMQELRYDDIRVAYVMPGSVATGFSGGSAASGADWKIASEDVAHVVLELCQSNPRSLASRIELRPSKPRK